MARPLREDPPSSAVARLLDVGAATRALSVTAINKPESQIVGNESPAAGPNANVCPAVNTLVKREFVLTTAADRSFCELVDLVRRATGTRLSASHVLRALALALSHARPSLESEIRRLGSLRLPSNAPGKLTERTRFERRIASALVAGMRAAAALDPDM